ELEQLIDVLGKRRANNPCLVGEPGVGKTAIVEGLAVRIVRADLDVAPLFGKTILELDMGRILAGTQDAANELKAALARGDFPCIGSTTHDEFRKHVEQDPALERRFVKIVV